MMKTHDQRKSNDCLRCCIATVLGLDYEDVPDFTGGMNYDQRGELAKWIDAIGCSMVIIQACGDGEILSPLFGHRGPLWIGGGPTERHTDHAVVFQGVEMVHDPHPSRAGLLEVTDAFVIWGSPRLHHGLPVPLIHEAGHAVIADALGFEVVVIEPSDDGYRTGFELPNEPTMLEHFLIAVATAGGPVAQDLAGFGQDDGCHEDLDLGISSLLAYLGLDPDDPPVEKPEGLDEALDRAGALARDALKARWSIVVNLAKAIHQHGRLERDFLATFFSRGA